MAVFWLFLRIREHGRPPAKRFSGIVSRMKKLMIMGGLIGFLIGVVFSSASLGLANPLVLFRASVAAAIGGLLLRWWGRLWIRCIGQARAERLAEEVSQIATQNP